MSVDNLFVFLLVFRYFKVPSELQHRVLFWGIVGAIVMRAGFIARGSDAAEPLPLVDLSVRRVLIYVGIRLLFEKKNAANPADSFITRFARRNPRMIEGFAGGSFTLRRNGKLCFTTLALVLLVVETTDLLFAVDSIPAVLAVTRQPYIVFTSNIFAILGLRALYFVVAGLMDYFHLLHFGLAAVLVFVGAKMVGANYFEIPTLSHSQSLSQHWQARFCSAWCGQHRAQRPRNRQSLASAARAVRWLPVLRRRAISVYTVEVNTTSIQKIAEADFPTRWGKFRIFGFEGCVPGTPATGSPDGKERRKEEGLALVMGDIYSEAAAGAHPFAVPDREMSSTPCAAIAASSWNLRWRLSSELGRGILIYEEQEGRGIGLMAKLQAYELQDQGLDTVEANVKLGYEVDCRGYHMPVEILKALGVRRLRLMSNNPEKVEAVEAAGIEVVERVPADVEAYESSARYIQTKREKMGHLFTQFE